MTMKTDSRISFSAGHWRRPLHTLLAATLMTMSMPLLAQDVWPQSEEAYRSDKPRAQWLQPPASAAGAQQAAPSVQSRAPVTPGMPATGSQWPAMPYAPAPSYPNRGGGWQPGWPAYGNGYAPYAHAPPPVYYPPRPYTRKKKRDGWWPGTGSWPDMNNFSMPEMPSPSFTTPSFSLPANPFGW